MRVPKWAKRLWEGWHHLDAARALFQFVREWSWVVFAAIKWGGGVGTIGVSVLLLIAGWVSGFWLWVLIGGAAFYTTAISAFAIMQSRRAPSPPIRQTSAPPRHPAHMGGSVEPVYVPEDEARPKLSADSLLEALSTQLIYGTEVLNGFKSVKSIGDKWPKDEYRKWQEQTSSILLNSARTEDHARWVRNTSIDISESLLDDFKDACEKGLAQLDKTITRLRILRE